LLQGKHAERVMNQTGAYGIC